MRRLVFGRWSGAVGCSRQSTSRQQVVGAHEICELINQRRNIFTENGEMR